MFDISTDASFGPYSNKIAGNCDKFICGDKDLDSFFEEEAFLYESELLGKSYCWIDNKDKSKIVAIITLAYNGINLVNLDKSSKNKFQRKIPNTKRHESYPAVLLGRLGVNESYQGNNIGQQILKFLQNWFKKSDNKAACRFIIVDALNKPKPLHMYEKEFFEPLYKTEEKEKEAYDIPADETLKSRIYYIDLKKSKPQSSNLISLKP